jgi:hypothetical protein
VSPSFRSPGMDLPPMNLTTPEPELEYTLGVGSHSFFSDDTGVAVSRGHESKSTASLPWLHRGG